MVDGVSARVRAAAEKSPSSATWTKTAMSRNSTPGLPPVLICENPSQQVGRQVCRSRRVLLSKSPFDQNVLMIRSIEHIGLSKNLRLGTRSSLPGLWTCEIECHKMHFIIACHRQR